MTTRKPAERVYDGTGSRIMSLPKPPKSIRSVALRATEDDEWAAIPASDYTLRAGRLTLAENPSGRFSVWPKGKATVRVTPW